MAGKGNGTTQYERADAAVTAPVNYSYAFWYKPDHVPNQVNTRQPFGWRNDDAPATNFDATFSWDFPDSTIYKAATHRVNAGSYVRCQILSSPAANVWHHIAVTYDGVNIKIYLNGKLENTVAAAPQSVTHNPIICWGAYNASTGFDTAFIAHGCVWSVALTAAEVDSLYNCTDPTTIQNASILSYVPLDAASDETIGPNFTNSGMTFNTTYFFGMTGGAALGGPTPAMYMINPTGGFAVGGPGFSVQYQFNMTGGFALGGEGFESFLILGNGSFVMQEGRGSAQTKR